MSVSSRHGSYVHRRANVMYIYICVCVFLFHLSNRCVSHFLVALVFRFDKVYVKIIGDAFMCLRFLFASSSFVLMLLHDNGHSESHTKEGGFEKNTFHYCYTKFDYLITCEIVLYRMFSMNHVNIIDLLLYTRSFLSHEFELCICILNDTSNVTDTVFPIFSKLC